MKDKNTIQKFEKENNQLTYEKIEFPLDLLLKGQEINQNYN